MPSFDFITDKTFRQSLESDYAEMVRNIAAENWKSAQVLAGSIVEALLIEHLLAVPVGASKDPLKLDLAEAISICRDNNVLSQRSADLCSVVRSYRNLIHPGRVVRLKEQAPDKDSATIAFALVELITSELSRVRQQQVGLTAEQLVSKVKRDASAMSYFKHLASEASPHQLERFLIEVLPFEYAELGEFDEENSAERMESAFATAHSMVSDDCRRKVASEFVRLLREADGSYITLYAEAFFRAIHIQYVADAQKPMVIDYLLGRMATAMSVRTLRIVWEICQYLRPDLASKWVDPLVRGLNSTNEVLQQRCRMHLEWANIHTSKEWDAAVTKRLQTWKDNYKKNGLEDRAKLLADIEDDMIPV